MKAALFELWFLATATDAVGAVLAVVYLRRLKTRLSLFLAVCIAGVAVEAVVASASLILFWPNEAQVAPTFALMRAAGRGVKGVCVWSLVLFLLNFCSSSIHKTITGEK